MARPRLLLAERERYRRQGLVPAGHRAQARLCRHARSARPLSDARVAIPRTLTPAAVAAPDRGAVVHVFGGETMGTTWSARLVGPARLDMAQVHADLTGELATIVAEMSNWTPDSAVSRFNLAAPATWLTLPPALFHVLAAGLALAEESGGAFDPTAGALVDIWGFGPAPAAPAPPDSALIEAIRPRTGWRQVTLDRPARRALQPGGIRLDLSGIAKGYAVDRLAERLKIRGHSDALVEIGGELRGTGIKPDGQPWWVAPEAPPGARLAPMRVALHGLSIATSGDYRRFFTYQGRRYAHSIDPRSGDAVANGVAAVTVLHVECMMADALATALLVMGLAEGMAFAETREIAALFVTRTDRGGFAETISPALAALLA